MRDPNTGAMSHTWSRLHEYLGRPQGPVELAIVRQCADDGVAEADDLDWKEVLPNGRDTPNPPQPSLPTFSR
jgi:hypothetical protein